MNTRRHQTISEIEFPVDWDKSERQSWLQVWKDVRAAKEDFKKVVLATGVFDLLHQEHRNFLRQARAVGNFLVVGVESDSRVRKIKGADRPIQNQQERCQQIIDTNYADIVEVLPEEFYLPEHHRSLLSIVRPHILAVSSNTPYLEAKRNLVELFGGELKVVHEHNPAISTTKIIEQQQKSK